MGKKIEKENMSHILWLSQSHKRNNKKMQVIFEHCFYYILWSEIQKYLQIILTATGFSSPMERV